MNDFVIVGVTEQRFDLFALSTLDHLDFAGTVMAEPSGHFRAVGSQDLHGIAGAKIPRHRCDADRQKASALLDDGLKCPTIQGQRSLRDQ